jgi:competence protein ComGC
MKKFRKKIFKSTKGITLIALVVTIIILLILAGISIAMLTGNNGVLTQAKSAKERTGEKGEQERVNLAASSAMTLGMGTITTENLNKAIQDEFGASKSVTGTGPWTYQGEYAKYKIEKAGTVAAQKPLPKTAEGQAKGTEIENPASYGENPTAQATADGAGKFFAKPNDAIYVDGTVDTGVVIKDKNNNEWVWVPVDDPTIMYEESEAGTDLAGDTGVKTNKYSKGNIISGVGRGIPNSLEFREPDILTDKDTDATAIKAGFTAKVATGTEEAKTALKVMAESLVQDYSDMIESIAKYKGFYIGRYELSTKTENGKTIGIEQKDKASQTNTNWYELYKYSKNIAGSQNMQTRMIWGCQWDVTCKWLAEHNYDINNSSAWGNYYDSVSPANGGNYEQNNKKNTGSNENWKANNIYDLAGNCREWTQEADSTFCRASRGGNYDDIGSVNPASDRGVDSPDDSSDSYFASRASLYIK